MTSIPSQEFDAVALLLAYRDGQRDFRNITLKGHFPEDEEFTFAGVDFSGAQLRDIVLKGIELVDVNFQGADFKNVVFEDILLERVSFRESHFTQTKFNSTVIQDCNFNVTMLRRHSIQFENVSLLNTRFQDAHLECIDFSRCQTLQNVDFEQSYLKLVNFASTKLCDCNFQGAKINCANFRRAHLERVDFSHTEISTVATRFSTANNRLILGGCFKWLLIGTLILLAVTTSVVTTFISPFLTAILPLFILFLAVPFQIFWSNSKANFCETKLKSVNFSHSRLENVNFSRANCQAVKFVHAQMSAPKKYLGAIYFALSSFFVSLGSILLTLLIAAFLWFMIDEWQAAVDPQGLNLFIVMLILGTGFLHFVTASVLQHMSEAIWGIPVTALCLLLAALNQPIFLALTMVIVALATIRVFQILLRLSLSLAIAIAAMILLCIVILLLQYESAEVFDLPLLQSIAAAIVIVISASIRTASSISEIGFFTGWRNCVVALTVPLFPTAVGGLLLLIGISHWFDTPGFPASPANALGFMAIALGILLGTLLGTYIGWQALRDKQSYQIIRDRGILFCYWVGCTSVRFTNANLSGADFSLAAVNNADFQGAKIHHASWFKTRNLETARFGKSYLQYPAVRKLLIRRQGLLAPQSKIMRRLMQGYRQLPQKLKELTHAILIDPAPHKLENLDLRGIRLSYGQHDDTPAITPDVFNLARVSFKDTDLREADLRGSNLENANLINANLENADLRDTTLTNAYIKGWKINSKTQFDQACCEQVYLDNPGVETSDQIPIVLSEHSQELSYQIFAQLLMQSEDMENITQLEEEFTRIDSLDNRIHREYKLNQLANQAQASYSIDADLYRQLFSYHLKAKRQAQRKQSWWQSILWFRIEPWIEKTNQLTQELDIFPLLGNLGNLSILVGVIAFVNNALKSPETNLEDYYRAWEILHADTAEVSGVKRFALEALPTADGSLVGINVAGENLEAIDLSGKNLTDADLSGANLAGAILIQATLVRANLAEANLENADMGYQLELEVPRRLEDAWQLLEDPFSTGQATNLEAANLRDANLSGVGLQRANLRRSNLRGANLVNADLVDADIAVADLTNANLANADLTDVALIGANLTNADLTNADLTGADLSNADLTNADLTGAILCQTTMPDGSINQDRCP